MRALSSFVKHRFFRLFLHVGSAALVFWFVSRRVHIAEVTAVLQQFRGVSLFPLFLFAIVGFVALALRWKVLLSVVDVEVSLKEVLVTNGRAIFYGLFLPGHVTSDLLKGWMMDRPQQKGDIQKIGFSVLLDKFLGLMALSVVGVAALFYSGIVSPQVVSVAGVFLSIVFFGCYQFFFRIPAAWITRWKVLSFLDSVRQKPAIRCALVRASGYSLLSQVAMVMTAVSLAWGLGLSQPFLVAIGHVVSSLLTALPVTFAGIGVREGVFMWALAQGQVSPSVSLVLSECLFLVGVLYGVVAWLYRPLLGCMARVQKSHFFHRYRYVIASLGIAFLFLLPSALFQVSKGYRGIYLSAPSDEVHYVSMVREVSEGYPLHANTYIFEERDGLSNIFQWNEVLVGGLFSVWPWGVDWFVWWVKFFSLALTAWLLFVFLQRIKPDLTLSWKLAIVCGWFVIPAFLGAAWFERVLDTLFWKGAWESFLPGFRFVNPIVTVLVFLFGVEWHARLHTDLRKIQVIVLGLLVAFANYLYIYFWMALGVYLGLWLVVYVLQKDWRRAKLLGMSLLMGVVLSIPFWVFIHYQLRFFALQTPLSIISRELILEKSVLLSVFLFFAWMGWKLKTKRVSFTYETMSVSILAATAVVAVNQHVITGHVVQPHHFYWMVNLPIAGFLLVFLFADVVNVFLPSFYRVLGAVVFFGIAFLGFGVQAQTVKNVRVVYQDFQRLKPAFEFIDRDPAHRVVYSDDRVSELLPMYTDTYVSYALHSTAYLTTTQERRRWALFVRLFLGGATDPESIKRAIIEERERVGMEIFEGQHYREKCGSYGCFSDEILHQLIEEGRHFLEEDFQTAFFRYRLDAILWDEKIHPEWRLDRFSFLEKVWEGEGVSVWRRRP